METMKNNLVRGALAVVAQSLLGAIWYSPLMFANVWIEAQGKTLSQMDQSNPIPFVFNFIYCVAYVWVMSRILKAMKVESVSQGTLCAGLIATSFTALSIATHYSFLQIAPTVILVDAGKEIVMGMLTGVILTVRQTEHALQKA
jgi:hypothetical protein